MPSVLTGRLVSFARNAAIYREGDATNEIFKVVSGTVRTCKILFDGRRQVGAFYLPGDMFGLELGPTHLFSSEAIDETTVLVMKRSSLSSFQLRVLMYDELKSAQNHFLLLVKTAPERVASFLLEMAWRMKSVDQVELSMSRRDIADYLGLTTETVCRSLSQLEKQLAIALPTSRRIVLRNRAALRQLVDDM